MKKLGIGLLGLVVVLVAALLIAPSFVDWNAQKGRISKEVFDLTGRDLAIDGDVSLAILPAPALSAARVRLANIEGGSAASMVELDALRVRIALFPLLRGEVQVESVDLVRPRILAEVLPDGRVNWQLAARAGEGAGQARDRAAADPGAPGGGIAPAIRLDRVNVTDGTLIYRDAATGLEERIEGLNAELAAGSLNGPFAASGQARLRGTSTEFEVSLGSLVSDGATPLSLGLDVPEAAASLQLTGALSLHGERASLRGRLKGKGENLAALVAALPLDATLASIFARPFSLETEIAADRERVTIGKLAVQLGDTKAEGEIQFTRLPQRDLRVALSATQIDLDALLAPPGDATADSPAAESPAGADDAAPQSTADPAPAPADVAAFSLPRDMTASLDLAIDAAVYRGQVVRQVLLSLALAEGQVTLGQALALLPGGSDVSLSGVLAPSDQADLRFDGRLEAASDNLRGILDWLGIDVAEVPASRLRKMSLIANIGATRRDVMLSDIDLRFDLSQISGGVAIAVRDRLGIGVGLALDKIDLDAYLSAAPQVGQASSFAPESGAGGAPSAAEARATDLEEAAARHGFAAPALLDAFDANFDLRAGQMTLRGVSVENLHLDATLQQGAVTLRELLLGKLGGAEARLAGSFAALTTTPVVDLAYDLSAPDLARLAKALDLAAAPLTKAKKLKLSGTVKGPQDKLALTGDLEVLGARLETQGELEPLADPLSFDLEIAAKHADLAKLLGVIAPDLKLDPSLGALDLRARLAGTPQDVSVSELSGQLGPLDLKGKFTAELGGLEPAIGDIDLTIAAKHPDLAVLVKPFAPDAGLAAGLGLDLKARVQGAQDVLRVSDIAGRIGPSEVSGTMGLDLTGARPMVSADLVTGVLPLADFAAPAAKTKKKAKAAQAAAGGKTAAGAKGPKASARWSRRPIDTAALGRVDAEVKLRAAALVHGRHRLNSTVVDAALKEGVLDLRKVGGTFHDGAIAITGQIDTREGIEVALALTAIELNLAKLAKTLADSERVSGPLNLDASIAAKGRSEAELISTLAGAGKVGGTLNVKAKAEEEVGALLLGILGQKVKEIRGVTDATTTLFGAFAGTPAALKGSFTLDKGVAETKDLRIKGREASALTQGTADLAAWKIDTRTQVFRAAAPDTPYLTAHLTGPLDKPNVKLGGQPFQRQPAAQPAQPGAAPAPAQPAAPTQIKPEDIIKEGLKGLLKGLKP